MRGGYGPLIWTSYGSKSLAAGDKTTAFTPTVNWTNTTVTGFYWRVNDRAYFEVKVVLSAAPAGTDALEINWATPTGLTKDTSKMVQTGLTYPLGNASIYDSGSNQYQAMVVDSTGTTVRVANTKTRVATGVVIDTTTATSGDPLAWAANDFIIAKFDFPVVEWG